MSYNGWSNYQTWNVKLWIDNEYDEYAYWLERMEELVEEAKEEESEVSTSDFADELESFYDDIKNLLFPQLDNASSMFTDIFGEAWGQVNWYEIAENMLSDFE